LTNQRLFGTARLRLSYGFDRVLLSLRVAADERAVLTGEGGHAECSPFGAPAEPRPQVGSNWHRPLESGLSVKDPLAFRSARQKGPDLLR
jgi:hypothetical protein